jgi:hypothetical protein
LSRIERGSAKEHDLLLCQGYHIALPGFFCVNVIGGQTDFDLAFTIEMNAIDLQRS